MVLENVLSFLLVGCIINGKYDFKIFLFFFSKLNFFSFKKYLLSGAPYEEGLLALKMAKQRDIIVSYSAWELQKGTNVSYCTGKPLSNDKFILLESINRNITPVSKPNSSNVKILKISKFSSNFSF